MSTETSVHRKIRVLVIDDSALVRQVLSGILQQDPGIEVVGTAQDPLVAREKIKQLNPDVLTLDVEMPRMDGVTFLRNLMRLRPMPVVMVSSLTERGADITLDALELGAVDFVAKPKLDVSRGLQDYAEEIIAKVRTAAGVKVRALNRTAYARREVAKKLSADVILKNSGSVPHFRTTDRIIAIGASTGGTEAIREVLSAMPADAPGMVITQHIPAAFSQSFAERMDRVSAMSVRQARDGDQIVAGHAYIAPGDHHLLVSRDGARFVCRLSDGPAVNRHRPSVDVLFRSVAQCAGPNAIGVLLTGMGDDGACGLKEIQAAGAPTLAQDEASSVVWGMPGQAFRMGAVDELVPLGQVAQHILQQLAVHEGRGDGNRATGSA